MTYYQIWLDGLIVLMKERGFVSEDEIEAGKPLHPAKKVERILTSGDVEKTLHRGGPTERDTNTKPAFKPGDKIRAKNINPVTHTRLPRYVRGKTGVIERINGCHVYPDTNAQGQGDHPQWLYTVVFDARELWGADADKTLKVSIDAFEPYLEKA
jgi:nitrile hydratase